MASMDDNLGNDSSKKRAAARQISKDDDLDAEEEVLVDGVSFQKAPDSVLASRRIVKVHRIDGTTTPATANPFASIRLVPPPQSTSMEPQVEVTSKAETHEDKIDTVLVSSKSLGQSVSEPTTEPISEIVTETVANSVHAADSKKASTDSVINGKTVEIDGASENVSVGLSSETFQQLSSTMNAFSGSFGTGFASTTLGSTQVASTTSFGLLTGGFSFASGPTFDTNVIGSSSGKAASSFQNSVVGKTNGNSTFQLFEPVTGLPSSTGITLQVESGEEKEKTVFAADASLFEFLDGGWNERGKGEIKVIIPEDVSRRPHLVMRSKGNLRLLLNANILPDMKITKMDNRGITFVCANAIGDGKVGLATYALKLREAQIAREFLSIVEAKKGLVTNAEP